MGQVLDLGEEARLTVLASGSRGAVILVEWDRFRALLPLGMNFEDFEALDHGKDVGPVTALSLADHGYAPANPLEWIANLHPDLILLCVSPGNRNELP